LAPTLRCLDAVGVQPARDLREAARIGVLPPDPRNDVRRYVRAATGTLTRSYLSSRGSLLGVRRGELAGIQIRDFDAQRYSLRVYGKGRKERLLPLRGPVLAGLRLFLSTDLPHVRRPPEPDDYLLYPTKKVYDGRGSEGQQKRATRA